MKICSVEGCNDESCEIIFLVSFAMTEDRAERIKFTQKKGWIMAKNSKICSEHFSPYLITANHHHLHNGAIPTLKGGDQLFRSGVEEGV
jgi:hypothetical protein